MKATTAISIALVSHLLLSHAAVAANEIVNPFTSNICEAPNYSESLLRKNSQGTVKLSYDIDLAGRAQNIQISLSSGDHELDTASISALKKCVFPTQASAKIIAFNWKIQ